MSTTVDERVVEMKFDNADFEKNVSTSMSTLDKLKQSLDFSGSAKGFDQLTKAANSCDVSSLGSAADAVAVKFSALQVVATTALANITNSAISAGTQLLKSLSVDNISAGWEKFGSKTTSVGTLVAQGYDINTVSEQLERLNWYTDETSYNFTDMVDNISKFTASGQDLETSVTAMEGIANWAALSGQNATTASRAMYQLSQAMSSGYMRLADWRSIETANMNTLEFKEKCIEAAVAVGTLQDNLDGTYTSLVGTSDAFDAVTGFTDSLTQGAWLTSDVMMDVFEEYASAVDQIYEYSEEKGITASEAIEELGDSVDEFGLKAFKAGQEARTWADVIDSVKDAVSTGWMNTFELLIGNYEEATAVWTELANTLYEVFAAGGETRNELLEEALSGSSWSDLESQIEETGVAASDFESELTKVAKSYGVLTDEMIDEAGSLEATLSQGWLSTNLVAEALRNLAGGEATVSGSTEDLTEQLEEFQNVVNAVIKGTYGNGQDRVEALTEAGYDYATIQELVNKQLENGSISVSDLSDAELENLGYTEDEIKAIKALAEEAETTGSSFEELINSMGKMSGRELLIDSIRNIGTAILNFGGAIKEAWNEIFPSMTANGLYSMLESFHEFTSSLVKSDKTLKKVTKAFKGLFSIVHLFASLVGGALKIGMTAIYTIIDAVDGKILNFAANVGDAITKVHDWFYENGILESSIGGISSMLHSGVEIIETWIASFAGLPAIQGAISKIQSVLEPFIETPKKAVKSITKLVGTIKEWLLQIYQMPLVQKVISTITTFLSGAFTSIKDYFVGGAEAIGDFIEYLRSLDGISFGNIGAIFQTFMSTVVGCFFDMGSALEMAKNAFEKFGEVASGCMEAVSGGIGAVKSALSDFIDFIGSKFNLDAGGILTMFFGGGMIAMAFFLGNLVKRITKAISNLTDAVNPVAKVLSGVKSALSAFAKDIKADALLKHAEAILVLAAAVWVLGQLNTEQLTRAVVAIAILAGIVAALSVLISKLDKTSIAGKDAAKNLAANAVLLLGIAGAVMLLVLAMKSLDGMGTPEEILDKLVVIGALVAGLVGALTILGKVGGIAKGGFGSAVTILALAYGVKLLVGVFDDIASIPEDNIRKGLDVLFQLVTSLALLLVASSVSGWKGGVGVLAMVLALQNLVDAFNSIANFDTSKVTDNIGSFILIFGSLIALMILSGRAGKNAFIGGAGILLMSIALNLIVAAMKSIAKMGASDVKKATGAVVSILAMFGILEALSEFSGENAMKAGVMLMSASVGILIIAGAMWVIAQIPTDGLVRALVAVELIGAMMAGLIAVTHIAGDCKGTLIVLAIIIGLLVASLGALSMIPAENLAAATASLSIIMGIFAGLVAATSLLKDVGGSTIAAIAVMGLVVALLANLLEDLTQLPEGSNSLLESAGSLALLIEALALAIAALSLVKVSSEEVATIAKVAVIAGLLAALATQLLVELSLFKVNASIETVGALSLLIVSLSAACLLLSAAGAIPGSAMAGVEALGVLVAGIGAIIGVLGGLDALTNGASTDGIEKGLEILGTIGTGIGTFFSNIGVGLTSGLPDMATNLSTFMTNLGDFIDGINGLDDGFGDKASALVSAVIAFSKTKFTNALASLFTSDEDSDADMETFKTQMATFGEAVKGYSDAVTGIDVEAVEASAEAVDALANLQNGLTRSGGFLQALLGTKMDLGTFGTNLTSFAEAIVGYSEAVSAEGAIDKDAVEKSADAAQIMSDLAQGLPSTDGKMQWFLGEKDLGKFGEQLTSFAAGLVAYSAIVSGKSMCFVNNQGFVGPIDSDAIEQSASSAELLSALANGLPTTGGVLADWFFGNKDLGSFGDQLVSFGASLVSYSDKVKDGAIDSEAIETSKTAADMLATLAKALPEANGLLEKATNGGDLVSIETFGNQLESFGASLKNYSDNVKDGAIDSTAIETSATAGEQLRALAEDICNSSINTNNIDIFGTCIEALGADIKSYFDDTSGIDITYMEQLTTAMSALVTFVKSASGIDDSGVNAFSSCMATLGSTSFEGLGAGFSESSSTITSAVMDVLGDALDGVDTKKASFQAAGSDLMENLVTGMNLKAATVKSAATSIVTGTYVTMQTYRNKFYTTGLYLVEGFASGITQNTYKAKAAAAAMASAANKAAQAALNEHSPSKEGYKTGAYYGEGFTNGIISFISTAYSTGTDLANAAKDGLNSTISTVASMVEDSLNAEPVIAPVLDLSNVQAGMQTVTGMFTNQTLSVNPVPAYQVSNMMSRIQNRSTDADVVSAIRKLGTDLSGRTGDTYNVNGVTYDDGSNITDAVKTIVRVARIERRT